MYLTNRPNQLFTDILNDFKSNLTLYAAPYKIDKEANKITVLLPGIGKENINIVQEDDILFIKFKKDEVEKTVSYDIYGYIPGEAEYKDGVLTIPISKDPSKIKDIKIK